MAFLVIQMENSLMVHHSTTSLKRVKITQELTSLQKVLLLQHARSKSQTLLLNAIQLLLKQLVETIYRRILSHVLTLMTIFQLVLETIALLPQIVETVYYVLMQNWWLITAFKPNSIGPFGVKNFLHRSISVILTVKR